MILGIWVGVYRVYRVYSFIFKSLKGTLPGLCGVYGVYLKMPFCRTSCRKILNIGIKGLVVLWLICQQDVVLTAAGG